MSGTWEGFVEELAVRVVGSTIGTVRTTLSQSGSGISGTWSVTYADPTSNGGGSVSGTVTGASLRLTLTPSQPSRCPLSVTATHTSATIPPMYIQGTYASANCTLALNGSVVLQKIN